jgi:hypothetical protein
MQAEYLYNVWFADDSVPRDDPDAEWVACILITAESPEHALSWGDQLARDFCTRRSGNRWLRSSVTSDLEGWGNLTTVPSIRFGELATDDVIGW